jgi:ribosomal protein L37AE/L43A
MAISRFGSFECDSCSTVFDGDPIDLIGANDSVALAIRNPEHRKMVSDFWLCRDCAPDYAGGVKEFFVASVFENDDPVCESCDSASVEEWGHYCDYCDSLESAEA